MRICSECGLDMDLVGLRHRCVPRPAVTPAVSVTKPVTDCLECERLRGEVEKLRRLLVEADRVGRPRVAMSGAERMRRLRARRRSQ